MKKNLIFVVAFTALVCVGSLSFGAKFFRQKTKVFNTFQSEITVANNTTNGCAVQVTNVSVNNSPMAVIQGNYPVCPGVNLVGVAGSYGGQVKVTVVDYSQTTNPNNNAYKISLLSSQGWLMSSIGFVQSGTYTLPGNSNFGTSATILITHQIQ